MERDEYTGLAGTYSGLSAPKYTTDRILDNRSNSYISGPSIGANQAGMLAIQDASFGNYGAELTNSALQGPSAGSALGQTTMYNQLNAIEPSYADSLKAFNEDTKGMNSGTGLSGEGNPWYKDSTAVSGILGAGQLGLGVASFMQNEKLMKEQLKGLKQNRQQSAAEYANRVQQREGYRAAREASRT